MHSLIFAPLSFSLSVEFRSTHFVFFLPLVAAWLTNAAIMAPPQFFMRPAQRSGGPISPQNPHAIYFRSRKISSAWRLHRKVTDSALEDVLIS
jgi:hypothetical protein